MVKSHVEDANDLREQHPHGGDWLREIVFGLNDGLVTTLVFIMVVSGVTSTKLVFIALGEVIAGGISMALGGYLSSDTVANIRDFRIATERHEIRHEPEEERAELRELYRRKGFYGPLLERIVDHLTSNEDRWLNAMITDELGVQQGAARRPSVDGLLVGVAFIAGGLVPVLPFFLPLPRQQVWAYGLTAAVALVVGALKSRYTLKGAVRSSLEFFVVVTLGTVAGVVLGALLNAA